MPFVGIGIHVLIALFFAVHVVRSGQQIYWLFILFSFPLLGSVVYFLMVYLPDTRLDHGIRKMTAAAVKSLDPDRERREAQEAFDLTPTAQNELRLARALLNAGATAEAVSHFDACLSGPFATDPELRFEAARARLENGDGAKALDLLLAIRNGNADFRAEQMAVLVARAYSVTGQPDKARAEFESAASRFASVEVLAEYAIWALSVGDLDTAEKLRREIERATKHWTKHTRGYNRPLMRRLEAAFASAR